MTQERLEKLGKLLPIGGVFLILCSSIKLVVYYNHFNISIADYLSIGEYATLFIDDILYYLSIFGIGILLNEIDPQPKKNSNIETGDFNYNIYNKQKKYIIASFILLPFIIFMIILNLDSLSTKLSVIKVGLFFILCLIYFYFIYTKYRFSYYNLIIVSILLHTFMDGFIDAQKIVENNNKINYIIKIEDNIITTNEDLHYIGKSEKYLFLYSLKCKSSTIVPISRADEIKIRKIEK